MKNTIKKQFQTFLVLVMPFLFSFAAACSSGEDTVTPEVTIPENILTNGMTFSNTGGSNALNIKSNVAVEVISSATDWCKVITGTSTSSTIFKYTITVEANAETNDREAVITVKAGGSEAGKFTVRQTATDGLIVDPGSKSSEISATAGNVSVKLTTNGTPTVTINDGWITEKSGTRAAMADKTYIFDVATNYSIGKRTGTITFTLGELTETVTVVQQGYEHSNVGMGSDAKALAAMMYAGINIGNTMEVPGGETGWGNPRVSKAYIDGLKAMGFNAVRIPCAWDSHIINKTTNEIDSAWLNRVSEVVGYCRANNMYAIVNIHWDGGWLEESVINGYNSEVDAKQKALWTQIATKLNTYDEYLLFAGCNEPGQQAQDKVDASAIEAIIAYEQTFINAVRATGGNNATRCLIVQGPYTNIDRTVVDYTVPTDKVSNRLMVEVHFYDPYQFSLMEEDADWGKVFWYWGAANHVSGSDRNATWGEESYVKEQFRKMQANYVDKGIPVILGEYSVMRRTIDGNQEAHDKSRSYWNEVVTCEAKNHGIVPFHWETGSEVNRNTGAVTDNYIIDGIMKGAGEGKYPF